MANVQSKASAGCSQSKRRAESGIHMVTHTQNCHNTRRSATIGHGTGAGRGSRQWTKDKENKNKNMSQAKEKKKRRCKRGLREQAEKRAR